MVLQARTSCLSIDRKTNNNAYWIAFSSDSEHTVCSYAAQSCLISMRILLIHPKPCTGRNCMHSIVKTMPLFVYFVRHCDIYPALCRWNQW